MDTQTQSTQLNDDDFEFLTGLWTGKKPPFSRAIVIRNTNFINDGQIDYSKIAILDVETKQLETRRLKKGDIIIERSGGGPKQPVGRVVYFDREPESDYSFSNFTSTIRVKNIEKYDSRFVFYFLHNFYIEGRTDQLQRRTTGIRNLDYSSYKQSISLPQYSLIVQREISQKLLIFETAIHKQETLLKKLTELKQSTVEHLFTHGTKGERLKTTHIGKMPESWEIIEAKDLMDKVNFGTSVKCSEQTSTYPVLRIPNVVGETLDLNEIKYCDITDRQAASFMLESGDLVFVRTNGSRNNIGKNIVFENQLQKCLFASFTIRARFNQKLINPFFVHYFTQSKSGSDYLYQSARPSAGKFNLNTQAIKHLTLPLPELSEQNNICKIIESVNSKIELSELKLKKYQDLYKTLLHELMNGERKAKTHA
jgi:type I restriction enzyme S subunit